MATVLSTQVADDGTRTTARRTRRRVTRTLAALAVAVPTLAVTAVTPVSATSATASPTAATAPYCGIRWGSTTKTAGSLSTAPVVTVRAGAHACYDRLVIEVAGRTGGYRVGYVAAVTAQGSGSVIPVAGGARLQITVQDPAQDPVTLRSSYLPKDRSHVVPVTGYRTFRQVVWAGSFEGYTSFGVGVRARLPFRVTVLPGPGNHSRIVIDVAHRW